MNVVTVPRKIQEIMEVMEVNGHEICAVGGCVRDFLLGRPIHDWDLCTSACPDETQKVFEEAGCQTILTGKKHGTITVLWQGEAVEITTYRIDGEYTDGRRPDHVTFTGRLEDDLSRRDFTINAMACRRDGEVIDLFGGRRDLAEGRIRCVGDPRLRFEEDGLRILRGLRFAARLGFQLEEGTAQAVMEGRERLSLISPERIWAELAGLMAGPEAAPVMERFYPVVEAALRLDSAVGQREREWRCAARCLAAPVPDGWSQWMTVTARFAMTLWKGAFSGLSEPGKRAFDCCVALRTDKATRKRVAALIEEAEKGLPLTPYQLRKLAGEMGWETVAQLIFLWEVTEAASPEEAEWMQNEAGEIVRRGDCISIGQLEIQGAHIQKLGARGPQIGETLKRLLDDVMKGELPNQRDRLEKRAGELLRESIGSK